MKSEVLLQRHNEKLAQRGIPYTAQLPYITGQNAKSKYVCDKGHSFEADRARVMAGKSKCPSCNGGFKLTHEAYEQRLLEAESPFYPLEKYQGMDYKIDHACAEGHITSIKPASILNTNIGCAYCSGLKKKTDTSYKLELKRKGIIYIPLKPINGVMNKLEHQCPTCDHTWKVKPHDILNGSGCPVCASMGFNRGKPAILYYVKLTYKNTSYYKIGITNKTVSQRFLGEPHEVKILLEKHYERGAEAEAAEQLLLSEYKDLLAWNPRFLRKGGNTELFKEDVLNLDVDLAR